MIRMIVLDIFDFFDPAFLATTNQIGTCTIFQIEMFAVIRFKKNEFSHRELGSESQNPENYQDRTSHLGYL